MNDQNNQLANPHTPVAPPEADEVVEGADQDLYSDAPGTGEGEAPVVVDGMEFEADVVPSISALAIPEQAPDTSGLRPIGEATYGEPVGPESVLGPDDRVQIHNTGDYPWRAHCSLLITANDGARYIGTGWFIGPKTVITAGHCVFIHAPNTPRHGWVQSIQVMPGRNGNALPYGSVTVPRAGLRSVGGWTNTGPNHEFDYGALILPTPLGSATGWLGYASLSDATLNGSTMNISGYPGDKPSGTQWYHYSGVAALGPRKVYYAADTYGGQSGSAVYTMINGGRYGVAVHAYGGSTSNSGTRVTQDVANNFTFWKS